MKKKILGYLKNEIIEKYPNYNNDKIDEIMYGLEGIYLTITKTIIIFFIAFILGITKELFFLLVAFNIIRLFAFGMHADSSSVCLLFSSFIFLSSAFICKYVTFDIKIVYLLYLIIFLIISIYAPADTIKRPLVIKKKRIRWKILSIFTTIIFLITTILLNNRMVTNYLLLGLIIECILILPTTYKLFKMPYCNYKNYGLNT